jgi:hypothetical protein
MNLGKPCHGNRETAERNCLSNQFHGVLKTVRMGLPIRHSLRRIPTQRKDIFQSFFPETLENSASIILRLANDSQMTHRLETALAVNPIDEINGFFARASARPVRNRTKSGSQRFD